MPVVAYTAEGFAYLARVAELERACIAVAVELVLAAVFEREQKPIVGSADACREFGNSSQECPLSNACFPAGLANCVSDTSP